MKVNKRRDDLTLVKYIGVSRQKILNDCGITHIEQLFHMPFEKLAEIKSIGPYFARRIKDAVREYYAKKGEKVPGKVMSPEEKALVELNKQFQKEIKRMKKRLNRLNEDLKPLWEKKYLRSYILFKKRANKLKSRLNKAGKQHNTLSGKAKKKVIKASGSLRASLKRGAKKPKKKKYEAIVEDIQSFSKMLRDLAE